MTNIRWANPEHIGICYDNGDVVVYLDGGDLYAAILAGTHGPIAEPQIIEGTPVPPTQAEIDARRQAAYQIEADPLFFKWQRGESTEQAWLDKIAAIRQRYPDATE